MSRMIPPSYDPAITSNGEKKIFDALKNLGDEYVVLHSLGVAEHQDKVFGEIDFVVLCSRGILCLEVKGGRVSRENGYWLFTDRNGRGNRKTEGPFMQAQTAMHSLKRYMTRQFGPRDPVSVCLYALGVAFPDITFTQKGTDIIPEVVFDARTPFGEMELYIHKAFDYWDEQIRSKHGFSPGILTGDQIARTANYLRGNFCFVPSLGTIVTRTGENLLALTREQMEQLEMAVENPRIVLKGGAGTGKTILSVEHARRAVLTGKRVLYLCFNRNLSSHLGFRIQRDEPEILLGLTINTFHGFLFGELKKYGCLPESNTHDRNYFEQVLPEAFAELTGRSDYVGEYDVLVIDEGQDLLVLEYLLCMDAVLKGGLRKGSWLLSYDENQNLYNPQLEEGLLALKENSPALLSLSRNCRNTRPVGVYSTLVTGIVPAKSFRVDGESVVREPYADFAQEKRQAAKTVRRLIAQGIKPGDICLLSRFSFRNSCLNGEDILNELCQFQDITELDPSRIDQSAVKFCTIHGFKGLEAPVILVLDIEDFSSEEARMLNYTAMSRSTGLVFLFYKATTEEDLNAVIEESAPLLTKIIAE